MNKGQNNFAYIDGANLHKGISELGWKLDYKKFRIWLSEKYSVTKAYIFLGFISTNSDLYRDLQNWGYIEKAIIVTGDGDFACLVRFLKERSRFKTLLSPNHKKASVLLRRAVSGNILFLERFKGRFEFFGDNQSAKNEKAPL